MRHLILASQSPRRRELLKLLGYPFEATVSSIEESSVAGEGPDEHVMRLSKLKALDIADARNSGIVIGSDTVVVLDGDILEKPVSTDDAADMLMRLQGRTHTVYTGFALADTETERLYIDYDTTEVTMRSFDKTMAENYVATKEPLDKAGSYGIQGYGAVLIESIRGCYFNVMGLPVPKLMEALNRFSDGEFEYFVRNTTTIAE